MDRVFPRDGKVLTTLRWPWHPDILRAHLNRLANQAQIAFHQTAPLANWQQYLKQWGQSQNQIHSEGQRVRLAVSHCVDLPLHIESMPWEPRPIPLQGLSVCVVPYTHAWATIKHDQREAAHLLLKKYQDKGFDDVIWQNNQGHWTEATTSNWFVWYRGDNDTLILQTPHPKHNGCLEGIARSVVWQQAHALNIPVIEQAPNASDCSAEKTIGAFLTNSLQGCQPIGRLTSTDLATPMQWFPLVHPTQHLLYKAVWDILFP